MVCYCPHDAQCVKLLMTAVKYFLQLLSFSRIPGLPCHHLWSM